MEALMRSAYPILLVITAFLLLRKRVYRCFPAFFCYLLISLGASVSFMLGFTPYPDHAWWLWHWVVWQPFLMLGLAAAVAELLWWVKLHIYPREARALLALMVSLSVMGACLIFRALPEDSTLVRVFSEIRRHFDIAIALSLLTSCGWLWIRPPEFTGDTKRHGLILTTFVCINASVEMLSILDGKAWQMWDLIAYMLSSLCLLAWSLGMRPANRRPPRGVLPDRFPAS
jgi:hypothetical protein